VKKREGFRPFAPSVLEEHAEEFFEGIISQPARFMAASARVRPSRRSAIPAVTHVDGSARPQVVSRDTNPLFWRLIEQFGHLSGVPVVLNTSFNEQEPIVCSPEHAIRTFLRTDIDALAIGPFYLEKCPSP
jgi:carbamoyltransferase